MSKKELKKGGKKGRKIGRKSRRPGFARYKAEERWFINKARKIARTMKKFPKYQPCNIHPKVEAFLHKWGFVINKRMVASQSRQK
jgi:hypothetical protein